LAKEAIRAFEETGYVTEEDWFRQKWGTASALEWATVNGSKFKVLIDETGIYEFTFESDEFPLPVIRALASQHRNLDFDVSWKNDQPQFPVSDAFGIRSGVLNLAVYPTDPRRWPEQHFELGGCPECGEANVYLNIGREAYCYCDEHKTCWPIGTIFSSWKSENEEIWRENAEHLADYEVVAPYTGKGPVPMKFLRKLDHPDFAAEVAGFTADGLFTNIVPDEPVSGAVGGGNVSPEMENEDVRYFLERPTNVKGDAVSDK
jgi:hypothetical protein